MNGWLHHLQFLVSLYLLGIFQQLKPCRLAARSMTFGSKRVAFSRWDRAVFRRSSAQSRHRETWGKGQKVKGKRRISKYQWVVSSCKGNWGSKVPKMCVSVINWLSLYEKQRTNLHPDGTNLPIRFLMGKLPWLSNGKKTTTQVFGVKIFLSETGYESGSHVQFLGFRLFHFIPLFSQ